MKTFVSGQHVKADNQMATKYQLGKVYTKIESHLGVTSAALSDSIDLAKTNLSTYIEQVSGKLNTVDENLSTNIINARTDLSAYVDEKYVQTTDETDTKIQTLKDEVIAVSGFLKATDDNLKTYIDDTSAAITAETDSKFSQMSGQTDDKLSALNTELRTYINEQDGLTLNSANGYTDNKIASLGHVFNVKGYYCIDNVPVSAINLLPTSAAIGDVYFINELNANNEVETVEYVCKNANTTDAIQKWQKFGSTVDLSNYATTDYVELRKSDILNTLTAVSSELHNTDETLASSLTNAKIQLNNTIESKYNLVTEETDNKIDTVNATISATKAELNTNIDNLANTVTTVSGILHNDDITLAQTLATTSAFLSGYTDTKYQDATDYTDTEINGVNNTINKLSGEVAAASGILVNADNALNTKLETVSSNFDTKLLNQYNTITDETSAKIAALSTVTDTKFDNFNTEIRTYINQQDGLTENAAKNYTLSAIADLGNVMNVKGFYQINGTAASAVNLLPTSAAVGDVYFITTKNANNQEEIIEYVCKDANTDDVIQKWQKFGTTVDLSNHATTGYVELRKTDVLNTLDSVSTQLQQADASLLSAINTAKAEANAYTDTVSSNITNETNGKIQTVNTSITTLETNTNNQINSLTQVVNTVSSTLTTADTNIKLALANDNNTLSAYTNTKFIDAKNYTDDEITTVNTTINNFKTEFKTVSGDLAAEDQKLVNTLSNVSSVLNANLSAQYTTITSETDAKLANAASTTSGDLSNLKTTLETYINEKAGLTLNSATDYTDDKIAALGNVFNVKGYYYIDNVPVSSVNLLPTSAAIGDVYFIDTINANGITETVEYVCKDSNTEDVIQRWQKFGATVDLSNYTTTDYVELRKADVLSTLTSVSSTLHQDDLTLATAINTAKAEANTYTDTASGKITNETNAKIQTVNASITALETNTNNQINIVNQVIDTVSSTLTTADTNIKLALANDNNTLSAYTDTKFADANDYTDAEIATVNADIAALNGTITTVSGNLAAADTQEHNNLVDVSGKLTTAINNQYTTITSETDAKLATAASTTSGDLTALKTTLKTYIDQQDGKTENIVKDYTSAAIAALGNVFNVKGYYYIGSTAVSAVNLLPTSAAVGDVYFIDTINANGITETVEYVCKDANTTDAIQKWQKFGTTVDLSNYATTNYVDTRRTDILNTLDAVSTQLQQDDAALAADINTAKTAANNYTDTVSGNITTETNSKIANVQADLTTFETSTNNNFTTLTNTVNTVSSTLASTDTNIRITLANDNNALSAYTDAKFTAANTYTDTEIGTVNNSITSLNNDLVIASGNLAAADSQLQNNLVTVSGKLATNLSAQYTTITRETNQKYAVLSNNITSGLTNLESNLTTYADTQDGVTLNSAKIYTDEQIAALGNIFNVKGYYYINNEAVSSINLLPSDAKVGDVYFINELNTNNEIETAEYVCKKTTGTATQKWQKFGTSVNLNGYATTNYVDSSVANAVNSVNSLAASVTAVDTQLSTDITNARNQAFAYTDTVSGQITTETNNKLTDVHTEITTLSYGMHSTLENVSGALANADNALVNELEIAKIQLSGYTDSKINETVTNTNLEFSTVNTNITAVDTKIDNVSGQLALADTQLYSILTQTSGDLNANITNVSSNLTLADAQLYGALTQVSGDLNTNITTASATLDSALRSDSYTKAQTALNDAKDYTDAAISGLGKVMTVKGFYHISETVLASAVNQLPLTAAIGDVYFINELNANNELETVEYVCKAANTTNTIEKWQKFGATVDLSSYATTEYVNYRYVDLLSTLTNVSGDLRASMTTTASATLENANFYTDALKAAVNLELIATSSYIDDSDADTLVNARAYTDSVSAVIENKLINASSYIDNSSVDTLVNAKAYTDVLSAATNDKLVATSSYINTQDTVTLTSAKSYTDALSTATNTKLESTSGYINAQDTATLTSAKSYTDALSTATDNKFIATSGYIDDRDTVTLTSANTYTDTKLAEYTAAHAENAPSGDVLAVAYAYTDALSAATDTKFDTTSSYINAQNIAVLTSANVYTDALSTATDTKFEATSGYIDSSINNIVTEYELVKRTVITDTTNTAVTLDKLSACTTNKFTQPLTEFTVNAIDDSDKEILVYLTLADTDEPNINFPADLLWVDDGSAFAKGQKYLIEIRNLVAKKFKLI